MLLQFTVENYLSFDEPTTFSMRAGKDKDLLGHVIGGKFPAVKGAAIYGANAAGKSNLVLAMGFAKDLIMNGRSPGQAIPLRSFGLGKQEGLPSGFHWQFAYEGQIWSYGFDVTGKYIAEEYLFARDEKGGTDKKWFERKTFEDGVVRVTFGSALRGQIKSRLARRLELAAENLRANQPFLTHAVSNNIGELNVVWYWFSNLLKFMDAESLTTNLLLVSRNSQKLLDFISGILRFADSGIESLITDREQFKVEDYDPVEFGGVSRDELDTALGDLGFGDIVNFNLSFIPKAILKDETGNLWLLHFKARHHTTSDGTRDFPLEWESEGTQKLIHLAPILFLLRSLPYIFIVDELDRRLHTLLVQEFVKIALGADSKGQLIFTTHDTNLLDNWLLRRDEIHFVQKDDGHSKLSRLSDWNVRKDLDYEKAYLRGSFEGRPYFGFEPGLQGLDVLGKATPPSEDELHDQIGEAA